MDEIIFEYYLTFKDFPPMLTTVPTGDRKYLKLLDDAILIGEPLTPEDLDRAFGEYDYIR